MAFDLKSWLTGFALGLAGKPFPLPQGVKEPIGYLYGHIAKEGETPTHTINGVGYVGAVRPDINNVWTDELKVQCPYAAMVIGDDRHDSEFIISETPIGLLQTSAQNEPWLYLSGILGCDYWEFKPYNQDTEWVYAGKHAYDTRHCRYSPDSEKNPVVWCNHALKLNGIVIFEETVPVPVYE